MRKIVTISLPENTAKRVEHIVVQEGYSSTSELFRDLLRARDTWTASPFRRIGENRNHPRISAFMKAVKAHAKRGAVKNLSRDHDRYLYGK